MARQIANQVSIDPRAEIGEDVTIGPFTVIGPDVRIGRGTRIHNGVTLAGRVTIGEENEICPGAVIGGEPQDLSYQGEATAVVIGDRNMIREGVTINRATTKEDGVTRLGNDNYLMACSHVAHDCKLGDHIVIANGTLLGGHITVDDHASISGGVAIHHFTSIGRYCFIGGMSRVIHDVPPYLLAEGNPARPRCINVVALKRNRFSEEWIEALAEAHRLMYRAKVGAEHACEVLRGNGQFVPPVAELFQFIERQQAGVHGRARDARRAA